MKKYIYIAATVLTATLAACQSEDLDMASTYMNDANAVHFSASIDAPLSRVNTLDNGDTWDDGDMIKVYNLTENAFSGKDEAVYQLSNGKWNLTGSKYIVWADGYKNNGKNYFHAFYPYTEGTTNTYNHFDLPSDQSSSNRNDANYIGKADLMAAESGAVTQTTETVNLQFQHLLSKVTVNIKGYNSQYESTKPSITGASFSLAKKYAYPSDGFYTAICNKEEIKALMTNGENGLHSFTAILLPEKYNSGTKFLSLTTADGTNLIVNVPGILTTDGLESGKTYTFDLVVGKNVINIENVTVNPWNGNDWDKKEGIADESYTLEVNNNVPTLTVLMPGIVETMNDNMPLVQELKKEKQELFVQGYPNGEDIWKLLEWFSSIENFKLDLTHITGMLESFTIFLPELDYNNTTIILPEATTEVDASLFCVVKGNLTVSLKSCKNIPPVNQSRFDLGNGVNITILITEAQREKINGTAWQKSGFTIKTEEDY